jgi:hypothetical protein
VRHCWVESADGSAVPFWVDAAYDEDTDTESVLFGSDHYFALAADDTVARWLSLSPEMILVLEDGSAVRVTTVE